MNANVDGEWFVIGLTSFGPVFCNLLPGVYTRVTSFHDWILTTMAEY